MGLGGHTNEMFRLLSGIDRNIYKPRTYAIASTDAMSSKKLLQFEQECTNDINVSIIERSRHVGQNYFTSIFTTIWAFFTVIPLVYRIRPKVILINGPGTCIPIIIASLLLALLFIIKRPKIVFVESICRVQTLSLTGKILCYLPVNILVQWPQLTEKYPKTQYIGRLV
ncbi:unnamed protein product [Didymodactylos carnosus]|uniref:UDP-N-acetylglucosamine transferase subunit ALG14 n=1 Tax=Didymodactylos carnosus TaxID=1234261 RepID=A0A813ZMS7_9BILA|nr:unnamed protein product [Didymodactylos carnosus]CAF0900900.1 unnamed protein product [Didymodactylos carnosus]CAF3574415.1 unnamed protein product [Didymodactylos carnosus]CAF3683422.1 unnamed protein product [Didymodactylos carnosus]